MNPTRTACIFGLVLVGCGGSTTDPGIPPEGIPEAYADWVCPALEECAGAMWDLAAMTDAQCKDLYTQTLEDAYLPRLRAAIEAGTVEYDAHKVRECLDAVIALGCDAFEQRMLDVCEDAIHGTVAIGDDCGINDECEGDAFCLVDASCPGTCAARLAEGERCWEDSNCQDGLLCQSGNCRTPAREGQDCEGTSSPSCAIGLVCRGGDASTTGTCTDLAEMTTEPEGADCNIATGVLCDEGLSCVLITIAPPTFECQAQLTSPGACKVAFPDHCPDGQWCSGLDIAAGDVDGTCEPIPVAGESCSNWFGVPPCDTGLACDSETDPSNPTCVEIENIGGVCDSDAGCYSGICDYGSCVEPDKCEVPD